MTLSDSISQPSMSKLKIIAWDFDGVINRSIVDGEFLWVKDFESDLGQSLSVFQQHVFYNNFDNIIIGREDLRDRVRTWASNVGYSPGPDKLLEYWFERDNLPDTEVVGIMDKFSDYGIRQVIATNNETRRARYIEREMEFEQKVEKVFASGRMGVQKPNEAFFSKMVEELKIAPNAMILVDDREDNVEQARNAGWAAFHFSDDSRSNLERFLLNSLSFG